MSFLEGESEMSIPEFWTDESEPNRQIFYHPIGDKIFQIEGGYERHWGDGLCVITKHPTLQEAFEAEEPEEGE